MAIENFIPTIWSENLYRALDQQYVGVSHCSREYEGEIKNVGSTVRICGVGKINIYAYQKDAEIAAPQALSDTYVDLTVNQGRYFNFQVDDADRVQCTPKLMDAAMHNAAAVLAQAADRYVFNMYNQAGHTMTAEQSDPTTILGILLNARRKLYENNVINNDDIVLEVSPGVAAAILNAKIATCSDNTEALEAGCIGTVAGCRVYVTNLLSTESYGDDELCHCLMRTKRAIAFVEQISEIEAYRPEKRFADAIKGLHLYGGAVIYPEEMVHIPLFTSPVPTGSLEI